MLYRTQKCHFPCPACQGVLICIRTVSQIPPASVVHNTSYPCTYQKTPFFLPNTIVGNASLMVRITDHQWMLLEQPNMTLLSVQIKTIPFICTHTPEDVGELEKSSSFTTVIFTPVEWEMLRTVSPFLPMMRLMAILKSEIHEYSSCMVTSNHLCTCVPEWIKDTEIYLTKKSLLSDPKQTAAVRASGTVIIKYSHLEL